MTEATLLTISMDPEEVNNLEDLIKETGQGKSKIIRRLIRAAAEGARVDNFFSKETTSHNVQYVNKNADEIFDFVKKFLLETYLETHNECIESYKRRGKEIIEFKLKDVFDLATKKPCPVKKQVKKVKEETKEDEKSFLDFVNGLREEEDKEKVPTYEELMKMLKENK